jgi:DNA polymerase-1
MIKIAMIRIHARIKKEQLQSKMILQVHDELLFDAFKPETDQLKKLVLEEMSMALPFNVPLVAAAGTGKNWLDAH